jgi:hypothetical protein
MENSFFQSTLLLLFAAIVSLGIWRFSTIFSTSGTNFPRIGPKPDAADSKRFWTESSQMIQEGYSKVFPKSILTL